MSRQKVDSEMIVSIAASKLSGALPALDGSALTGISDIITGASDPVVSTNPSGGVGSVYLNTSDGEMFVCTDATAGANIWTNVGAGSDDVVPYSYTGGATIAIYHVGGTTGPAAGMTDISKINVAADTAVNAIADLEVGSNNGAGSNSNTHGYLAGRMTAPATTIERFSFATDNDTTDIGDLLATQTWKTGSGGSSATHGYFITGYGSGTSSKYTFAASTTSTHITNVASDTSYRNDPAACSSDTHIYVMGGYTAAGANAPSSAEIDRFSIANEGSWVSHGDLQEGRAAGDCTSQTATDGYLHGGIRYEDGSYRDQIDKFSFSSNTTATDIGSLMVARNGSTGNPSTTHGYTMGGGNSGPVVTKCDKFNYSGAFSISDVAGLTTAKRSAGKAHN